MKWLHWDDFIEILKRLGSSSAVWTAGPVWFTLRKLHKQTFFHPKHGLLFRFTIRNWDSGFQITKPTTGSSKKRYQWELFKAKTVHFRLIFMVSLVTIEIKRQESLERERAGLIGRLKRADGVTPRWCASMQATRTCLQERKSEENKRTLNIPKN